MRQISERVYAEIYFWGCNPGFFVTRDGVFMVDTPQQPIDAVCWRERILERAPIRHVVNTEPHPDHIRGNAYFPGVEVIGQQLMGARYTDALPIMTGAQTLETGVRVAGGAPPRVSLCARQPGPLRRAAARQRHRRTRGQPVRREAEPPNREARSHRE